MCGFVGVASDVPVCSRSWLGDASEALIHRGPDDAGEWWSNDGQVGLAHRRLSVIDLSSAGHQPMHSDAWGVTVVFNGEIYNFRELRSDLEMEGFTFRSSCDTEVLLAAYAAWGRECFTRLNGMFALAIYDSNCRRVVLGRDRAGEKPLFYRYSNGTIHFASELKALMVNENLPRRIDLEALDCYLAMGFVPGDRCILEGFKKLPPGHALSLELGDRFSEVWPYWQLPEVDPAASTGSVHEDLLVERLENLLEDAVGRQMVADVPVGVLLSGGVDSSLVTAMAVRRSSKVRTFTIGFPGYGGFDETEHARLIAQHFNTEHTELMAEATSASVIPLLARQFDEPIGDSSMIPTWLVSHLISHHCTVALGGDGGDELFGGYNRYSRLLSRWRWLSAIPHPPRRFVSSVAERCLPIGFKGRYWLQALDVDVHGLPLVSRYFDGTTRQQLMAHYADYKVVAETIRHKRIPHQTDLIQRATRMDFCNYLPEDILVKVDRASMLNSLEVRAPLLDYHVVEFAFREVPSRLKTTRRERKVLLKRLARTVLPEQFKYQRKQGLSIPLSEWLKGGPFRELFWSVLTDRDCIFDHHVVRSLLRGQDRGYSNGERLFALVQFELWRREYGVK